MMMWQSDYNAKVKSFQLNKSKYFNREMEVKHGTGSERGLDGAGRWGDA